MTQVSQSFDVKITITRPHLTKDISGSDLQKINANTKLKYETLKTRTSEVIGQAVQEPSESKALSDLESEILKLENLKDNFDQLVKQAEDAMKAITLTYDPEDIENEILANSERGIFGFASGSLGFEKYKELLELEEIVNKELQERMINNGGKLDVSA